MKKFTTGEGRTVVPTSEYLARLTAARMQIDILGAETVSGVSSTHIHINLPLLTPDAQILMCRCDTDHAGYITSVIDPRDHPYILGATKAVKSLVAVLSEVAIKGGDLATAQKEWIASAGLMTFDELVASKTADSPMVFEKYRSALAESKKKGELLGLPERRQLAASCLQPEASSSLFFDWELPRTFEGPYRFAPTVQAVIDRALLAAPLGEVTWARMDYPDKADIDTFHEAVRAIHPDRKFGFGYTGAYDYLAKGWTPQEIKEMPWDMSKKYGIVWHVQPIWVLQGGKRAFEDFSRLWQRGGIAAYLTEIQAKELNTSYPGIEPRPFGLLPADLEGEINSLGHARLRGSGAFLADSLIETATMGIGPGGKNEKKFALDEGVVRGPASSRFG